MRRRHFLPFSLCLPLTQMAWAQPATAESDDDAAPALPQYKVPGAGGGVLGSDCVNMVHSGAFNDLLDVAPITGAWIETRTPTCGHRRLNPSRPSRARGLKQGQLHARWSGPSRAHHGRVD